MLKLIFLGWIAGIATMGHIFDPISAVTLGIAIGLYFLFLLIYLRVAQQFNSSKLLGGLLGIFSVCLSFSCGVYYADQALTTRLEHRVTTSSVDSYIIYINRMGEQSQNGIRQPAQILNENDAPIHWVLSIDETVIPADTMAHSLAVGQYYRAVIQRQPVHGYAIQGAFDVEKWFVQQNWQGRGKVVQLEILSSEQALREGYYDHVKQQQSWTRKFLLAAEHLRLKFRGYFLASSLQHQSLLLALLTGDRSLLDPELEQQFQRFGISHLLAISGPHVLIFAALMTWCIIQLINRYYAAIYLVIPRQRLMLIPFLLCVFLYCALVGFEIPALRTLLTVTIVSIFILLKRPVHASFLLLFSASILLLIDPFSILSAAFWLSYGACFILIRIYQEIVQEQKTGQSWRIRIGYAAQLLIRTQWKIFLALLPLTLLLFKQFSWMTPFANIIAIPVLGAIVVPLDVIAACFWLILPAFGHLIFQLNDGVLQAVLGLFNMMDHIFAPELQYFALRPWMIISISFGILILFLPKGTVPKCWSIICCVPVFLPAQLKSPTQLVVLDVGQGQSVFIQDQTQRILLDTGGNHDEQKFSVGRQVVVPFLKAQGVKQLDRIILSHLDQDHSGALPAILDAISVTQIQANEPMPKLQSTFELCYAGQRFETPETIIQVLSPALQEIGRADTNRNESSCVMHIEFKNNQPIRHFLIMGDAGWETEFKLLQHYPDLRVDVLVLGHHGSRHSSAYDFLQHYRPQYAIASAGATNRYGHPSIEVQARLAALQIPLLSTAKAGSISFSFDQANEQPRFYRHQYRWLTQ
ncbi:DNA internalization-related competence protein ComEC/Rec2 [Acinetobacter soli]|uniref:DNA internalization-related competence protein ComEC/Rec2 n=1 Tax=Acinetobacter soli TaxID=487316 RepID=UPI001D0B9E06|nr:DNA internalization-related competence protein ComEC/Rec2 [Acinetobacter soli]MCB8767320.1 DNA internalization-related competence protein ComEC/Rec2 [Acinetobacter soli]